MATEEYIWVDDAAEQYKRSRDWLFRQIREKKLTGYTIPGDRKVYLSRKELDEYLTPRPIKD